MMNKVLWKILNPQAVVPKYATDGSNAVDLVYVGPNTVLLPKETLKAYTGLAVAIPKGYAGLILPRSGLGTKGIIVANNVGLIDSDYRGEIIVALYNRTTNSDYYLNRGERIAQMTFVQSPQFEMELVEELPTTERGEGGFGSTGA